MGFEKQPDNQEEEVTSSTENLSGSLFEFKKIIGGIEVSVNVEKDGSEVSGSIDLANKKAEWNVTPEAIRSGLAAFSNFLDSQGVDKKLHTLGEKLQSMNEDLERKRDEETIRQYAEEKGVTEVEIIKEILDDLDTEK